MTLRRLVAMVALALACLVAHPRTVVALPACPPSPGPFCSNAVLDSSQVTYR